MITRDNKIAKTDKMNITVIFELAALGFGLVIGPTTAECSDRLSSSASLTNIQSDHMLAAISISP